MRVWSPQNVRFHLRRGNLALLALTPALLKLALLIADRAPALFLGDSGAYLTAAATKWIPLDRSFLYGLLLRRTAYAAHSLDLIVWLQSAMGAAAAFLLAYCAFRIFRTPYWIALLGGALCAVEPLQLLAERYVLTEACANLLFAFHLTQVLLYLSRRRLKFLVAAQCAGVLLCAFRISFLPAVLLDSIVPPLLLARRSKLWVVAAHVSAALLVSQSLFAFYGNWYGRLADREPALFYDRGAFMVAALSPLIEPEDFPDAATRDRIFGQLLYDTKDPFSRPAQHFRQGGLCTTSSTNTLTDVRRKSWLKPRRCRR